MDVRRSNIEIMADILRLGRVSRTDILYGCDLSYHQLIKYLHFLIERGFLKPEESGNSRRSYIPTTQGGQLLVHIDRVREIMQLPDRDADPREQVRPVNVMAPEGRSVL